MDQTPQGVVTVVCENRRMSFLMGKLLELQREQQRFELLIRAAPNLGLLESGMDRIAELLRGTSDDGLRELLLRSPSSVGLPDTRQLVEVTAAELLNDPLGPQALTAYPLDSPKMLGAAEAHGVDEHILQELHEQLDYRERR